MIKVPQLKHTTRIVTIRVKDPEMKMFLKWLKKRKGNMSEFTRQLWKLTEEWDEFSRLEDKSEWEECDGFSELDDKSKWEET